MNDRSECSKIETNRVKSKRDDVSTFIKFAKTRLLSIALNVLPRFETNYSEKNQKQTRRCFDFHKIFQRERRTTSSVPNVSLRAWFRRRSRKRYVKSLDLSSFQSKAASANALNLDARIFLQFFFFTTTLSIKDAFHRRHREFIYFLFFFVFVSSCCCCCCSFATKDAL